MEMFHRFITKLSCDTQVNYINQFHTNIIGHHMVHEITTLKKLITEKMKIKLIKNEENQKAIHMGSLT